MKYLQATIKIALASTLLATACAHSAPFKPTIPNHNQKAPANNYMGASAGITKSDLLCGDFTHCSDDDESWKVYSGVRLNDTIVLEGGYIKFGDISAYDEGGNRITSSMSGYTTSGLATYQATDQIEVFGKGGMLWWDNERSAASGNSKNSGSSTFLGVGANYDMGDNVGVRAEWERFEGLKRLQTDTKDKMDLISVGITFSSL